ncbi:MAG: ATP-dependent helicase [Candidatus Sericytochromatia bacterium]|nr:ATP-dependent helicase [Candidatus Sericytochromatia bacterium]
MQLFLTDPLLEGLNEEQQRAVTNIDGAVQLVASAGSGKTTVLTRRIAYMLKEGIKPESILAVTFTKKAATEMQSRLKKIVSSKKIAESVSVGTYHSLFLEILKPHYALLGFTGEKPPALCIDNRQKIILKTVLSEVNSSFVQDEAVSLVGQIKNTGVYPEEYLQMVSRGLKPVKGINDEDIEALGQIYFKYQKYLLENNLIDFDDILMLTRKLLQTSTEVREKIQAKYKYLLVDEFQDVNQVQYDITKLLAFPQNNLFVVGDDAQSIYQFRGSDVNIILNFSVDYPNTKIIKLESNYRCTPEIIDLSNKLIKFNREQIPKVVKAHKNSLSNSVSFTINEDVTQESFNIAKQIKGFLLQGIKPEEIAVLYRNHTQASYLEEDLVGWNIPYVIHKSGSFYDMPEIQDMFAYLYLARGEKEDLEQGMERAFRAMSINNLSAEAIRNYAKKNEVDMLEACMAAMSLNIHPGQKPMVDRLVNTVLRWQAMAKTMNVADLINAILESSGYVRKLEHKGTESSQNSINNLSIIYDRALKWECKTITEFFKAIEQQEIRKKEAKGKKQAVQLMTIHSSKGMEFDAVFLMGVEEDILPHKKSVSIGNVSEERRLCYVAITRARKYLNLSRVDFRNRFGKRYKTVVSPFWQEMNDQVTI